jgi:hypothetical protein
VKEKYRAEYTEVLEPSLVIGLKKLSQRNSKKTGITCQDKPEIKIACLEKSLQDRQTDKL